jgi:hypothetical protein
MFPEKGHKLELLVDLAPSDIIYWQSRLVLRPHFNEGTRGFMRCVFYEAARKAGQHRCLFQEFIV